MSKCKDVAMQQREFKCCAARCIELRVISSPVNASVKTGSASDQHLFPFGHVIDFMCCSDVVLHRAYLSVCLLCIFIYVGGHIYIYIYVYIYVRNAMRK